LDPNSPAVVGFKRSKSVRVDKIRAREREARLFASAEARPPADSPSTHNDPERWDASASEGFQCILCSLASLMNSNNGGKFMISVYGASEGTAGNSIVQEGERSGLTARGYGLPVLAFEETSVRKTKRNGEETVVWYTPLDGQARRTLGPPGVEFFDAGTDKKSSSEVEHRTQLLVEKYMEENAYIEKAWRHIGMGFPKGSPPYKVGYRIFPINPDGSFPNGAVRTSPDGPVDSHGELL